MKVEDALLQEASWLTRSMKIGTSRLITYRPKQDNQYQCPCCWIRNEAKSALRSVPSGSDEHDLLRCNSCDADIVIPL